MVYDMIWIALPDDIKSQIKDYIIKKEMSSTSVLYFKAYYDVPDHTLLRRMLLNVIRKDHDFVFKHLFNKYYSQFKKSTRYRYDGKTYKHFAEYLKYRTIEQEASRCRVVICEKLTNEYKWM
jgi:hypothetical protein